ncbi:YmjA family protein [Klebsiella pneumoniae]|uniref:YmjA family protein n=4 Tax=Klebsiella pneumoniae TaxID=573 RepID=UPI003CEF712B
MMSARRCALTLAPTPPLRTTDEYDIPLKFYDIVDEYETEAAVPVKDEERDALARYFQLLIARLTNNEEIDEEAQREMAREAAINENRIDDIANFLNQWGNE